MTRSHRFGPWVAVILAALVAVLSIVAALVLAHSVNNQNRAELQSKSEQVSQQIQSALTSIGPQLHTLDIAVQQSSNPAAAFGAVVQGFGTRTPGTTVALVQNGQVVYADGPLVSPGQPMPSVVANALAGAPTNTLFSPGMVMLHAFGRQIPVLVFEYGSTDKGGGVVELVPLSQAPQPKITKNTPYSDVDVAIYAKPVADNSQIIITTTKTPLTGAVVKTTPQVATGHWLVVASAKSPLAGSWPNAFPWILLVAGLMLAVVLGVLVSVIGRRERYAQELVAERTAELEVAQSEMVRRERLSAVGEMATMIGHELRNPLGAAINGLYLVRHNLGDHMEPPVERGLNLAERETQRAASLADDLTTYMRERRPNREHIAFGKAVDEVLEATPPPEGIEVRVENRDVSIDADAAQLTQMLSNCVSNAYQAMPEGGSVTVGAASSNGNVEILVDDTGPGFEGTAEVRAFDPFFTTKAQGTGLGLAIVQRMAEGHGGSVSLENRETGGARVVIRLPNNEVKAGDAT